MIYFSVKKGIIHSHRDLNSVSLSTDKTNCLGSIPSRLHSPTSRVRKPPHTTVLSVRGSTSLILKPETRNWLGLMIIVSGGRDVSTSGVHSWNVSPDTSSLLDQISRSCTQPHTPGLVLPVGNSFTIHLVTIMQWLWQQEHNFQDSSTQSIPQVPVENVKWTRLTYWKGPSWDPEGKRVYSTRFPGIEVGNLGKMPKVKLEYRG